MNISNFSSLNKTHPKLTLSDQYSFIPTTHIIGILSRYGWSVSNVSEARVIKEENEGFQKHIVRFSNHKYESLKEVGDIRPEIILYNSHDGCSSFQIMAGLFRLACSNGLVVSDGTFETHKIRHVGFKDQDVIDAVYHVADTLPAINEKVKDFSTIQLTQEEQYAFAKSAALIKWDEEATPDVSYLLRRRRRADMRDDLFTTYNRVQEGMMRGGLTTVSTKTDRFGRRKTIKAKAVKSVQEDIRINKALWTLTEEMEKLKILPF